MKILLIKFRNIGDVLLSTALLENLKLNYPNAEIDYALNSNCLEVIQLNKNVKNIFPYSREEIKKLNLLSKIKAEIKYIKNIFKNNYDIIINLTEGDRGSFISFLCKSRIKLGYKPRKGILKYIRIFNKYGVENNHIHAVEKDLQFIKLLNKDIINKKISIYWSKKDKEEIDLLLKNNQISSFVHIHPVSRWMFKCWDDSKMAQTIDYIQKEKKIKVIITSSPDKKERSKVSNILELCKTKPINIAGQLSLKQLAYLSSKAKLFFGVDTAPMHIAAAVDCPTISLFGASYPQVWGPWDNNSNATNFKFINGIQKSGMHSIVSNVEHTIYYENEIKKSQGMTNMKFNEIKTLLDKFFTQDDK